MSIALPRIIFMRPDIEKSVGEDILNVNGTFTSLHGNVAESSAAYRISAADVTAGVVADEALRDDEHDDTAKISTIDVAVRSRALSVFMKMIGNSEC